MLPHQPKASSQGRRLFGDLVVPSGRALSKVLGYILGFAFLVLLGSGKVALFQPAPLTGQPESLGAQAFDAVTPLMAPIQRAEAPTHVERNAPNLGGSSTIPAEHKLSEEASEPAKTAPTKVDLNTASIEKLCELPGIGPKKAQAILALREKLGRFRRLEDLLRIKGIGRRAIKRLRPLVLLSEPTDASQGKHPN